MGRLPAKPVKYPHFREPNDPLFKRKTAILAGRELHNLRPRRDSNEPQRTSCSSHAVFVCRESQKSVRPGIDNIMMTIGTNNLRCLNELSHLLGRRAWTFKSIRLLR
eukprot:298337-Prorocentrum_minimum.AAC.1